MNFLEIIKSSIATLKSNGRRTILTMFGIIVGIASVITIMSLGNGFKEYTISSLTADEDGSTTQDFYFIQNDSTQKIEAHDIFSDSNLQYIRQMEGVSDLAIKDSTEDSGNYVDFTIGQKNRTANLKFTDDLSEKNFVAGRPLNENDARTRKPYIVLHERLLRNIYPNPEDSIHQVVRLQGQAYTIVGVFSEAIPAVTIYPYAMAYAPSGNEFRLKAGGSQGNNLNLKVYFEPDTDIRAVSETINAYLSEEGKGINQGQYVYVDTADMMQGVGNVLNTITYFISAVAGISLFIAGVGVMNMMYISVSERTKEIGIRRAIGASKSNIQMQFLLEGIVITTIGGVIGYIYGIIIAKVVSHFLPFNSVIDWTTALLSVVISVLIGIVFSVFPARSAAQKNVIDILR